MAADERLLALKKAYADIIFNTTKEAAARIVLSERKAQRFQRELQVAKDETLRILLRLKQMMDFKLAEAETRSLSQQGKIEELEAQLQEAEDIVKDLRDELWDVQSELERIRNNKLQHLDEKCSSMPGTLPEADRAFSSKFFAAPAPASQSHYVAPAEPRTLHEFEIHNFQKFCKVEPDKAHSNDGSPDMPSTILVSKEPELYRNGSTQRIHASEADPSARNPSFSGQMTDNKDEKFDNGTDNGVNSVTELPCDSEKQKILKTNQNKDELCCDSQLVKSFLVRRKQASYKRKWGYALRKHSETSSNHVSCMEAYPSPVRSVFDVNTSQECQQLSLDRAEPVSLASGKEVSVNEQSVIDYFSLQNPVKKTKVTDEIAMHESGSEDNSVPDAETGAGSIQLPESNPSRSYEDQGTLGHPISERVIKITFQRKRKKETLGGCNGSTSVENVTSKEPKIDQDEQIGPVEEEKPNLATRSCRGSRRLVQVARQTLSKTDGLRPQRRKKIAGLRPHKKRMTRVSYQYPWRKPIDKVIDIDDPANEETTVCTAPPCPASNPNVHAADALTQMRDVSSAPSPKAIKDNVPNRYINSRDEVPKKWPYYRTQTGTDKLIPNFILRNGIIYMGRTYVAESSRRKNVADDDSHDLA